MVQTRKSALADLAERAGEWLVEFLVAWWFVPAVLVDEEELEHVKRHAVVIGSGGVAMRILPRARRGLLRWLPLANLREKQRHLEDPDYRTYLDRMMQHLREESRKGRCGRGVLLFIHGGNLSPRQTVRNCSGLYKRISADGYYPIFINWDANLFRSYRQQVWCIRRGGYSKWAAVSSLFYQADDVTRSLALLLPALGEYAGMLWRSTRWYRDESLAPRNVRWPRLTVGTWQPALTVGRACLIALSLPVQVLALLIYGGITPRAWEGLLRRIHNMFRGPREFDPGAYPKTGVPDGSTYVRPTGAMAVLLDRLAETLAKCPGMRVTVIAHSKGSVVANEALLHSPDLPFKRIVYLAPACSVRDFHQAVGPVVARGRAEARVLTLHPRVEAGQRDACGLVGGSVLEWLERYLASPHSYVDRAMGKWDNIVRTLHIYEPAVRRRLRFKCLPYAGENPQHPTIHVDFDNACLDPPFWSDEFLMMPVPRAAPPPVLAVLAGGTDPGEIGAPWGKALLPFGGQKSLTQVLEAADRSCAFRKIVVVGPAELDPAIGAARLNTPCRRMDPAGRFTDNIQRAFAAANIAPTERLVLAAADIPLVGPDELARFAEQVRRSSADVCVALARPTPPPEWETLLPLYRRTMIVARRGPYLLGNLFGVRSRVLEYASVIEEARELRSQSRPVNRGRTLGLLLRGGTQALPVLVTWLRLVLARALWLLDGASARVPATAPSTEALRRAVEALAGHRIAVEFLRVGEAGACFDVDTAEQREAVQAVLGAAVP